MRGVIVMIALLLGGQAFGAEIDQAKRDGLIGERADGYLGLVKEDASDDVALLVRDINAKRRAEYRRIAQSNDLSMEEVQALAGRKAIERTEAGAWILTNGGWRRK